MNAVILLVIIALVTAGLVLYKKPRKKTLLPNGYKKLLEDHVAFYQSLDEAGKHRFEEKIQELLGYISITGVNTKVDDLDKLLVASSGVIPIFGFPEWRYYNLREVLLYPDSFNGVSFLTKGEDHNVLGMVGDGAMQQTMILSKQSLHEGFANTSNKENTGIHEFVHLLDKEDAAVDGLPEALLKRKYTIPWLHSIAVNIEEIKAGKSDFNVYGSKNKAEFFAVASEYFFERPELFKQEHRELYDLMTELFNQHPGSR